MSRILAGSAVGQGVVILSYPVLARLYDPSDFGLLVVFTAVVSMIGVLSTASLEAAVLIPATDEDAAPVAWASLTCVALTGVVTGLVWWTVGPSVAEFLGAPAIGDLWWLIALTVVALGGYLVLSEWMVRLRHYGALGARNLMQGVGQVLAQVSLGLLQVRPVGLLVGLAAGRLLASGGIVSRGGLLHQPRPRLSSMAAAVHRFRRFPLVASWSKLVNTAGLQVPFLVVAAMYGDVGAGLLGLTVRVIGGPVGVVGQAVYQVITGEASAEVRASRARLGPFLRGSVLRLLAIGAGPAVLLAVLSPMLFGVVFGDEWAAAGTFAQLLAISYLADFAITPISQTLWILERQGVQLAWDCSRLVLTAGGVALCGLLGAPITVAVGVLAAAHVTCYAVLYFLSIRAARASDRATAGA